MPELPEIETVRLQLHQAVVGEIIEKAEIINPRTVQGNIKIIENKKITGIRRRAKVLIIDLESGISMAFHFKMTGQLILVSGEKRIAGGHPTKDFTGELPSKHTRVIFHFPDGKLYFNDQRHFGWIRAGTTEEINNMEFLKKLGPEIWQIREEDLKKKLLKIKRPIKLAIMDQQVLSGVGNIYANDALWFAEIDPRTPSNQITSTKFQKLYEGIKQVLEEGIKYGGATAADAKYIDLHGLGGHYQDHFKVYDREGKPCLRNDGGIIKKIQFGGRGTYWCPVCQNE